MADVRMTAVDELVAFVRAQLDARELELAEDERVAREITAPEWSEGCSWLADLRDPLPSQRRAYGLSKEWQLLSEADTRHIARWDPARVLAEVAAERADIDAKRRILDIWETWNRERLESWAPKQAWIDGIRPLPAQPYERTIHEWAGMGLVIAVKHLAEVYAGHPGFREEWRVA